MIRRIVTMIALVLALTLGGAVARPALAAQQVAIVTADVNLRAGPGTRYPVVDLIPYGSRVIVHGCIAGYSWCDVSWGASRGWVAAAYLQVTYRGAPVVVGPVIAPRIGITIVVFDHGYWVRFYSGRPWYHKWSIYGVR